MPRSVDLLERHVEVRERMAERCRQLFVDEYQDVNAGQEQLVRLLAPAPSSDVCVVGNPDQAIYGFRGSEPRSIERFLAHYPQATVALLTRNHRSPVSLVRAATHVIERAPGRKVRPLEAESSGAAPAELIGLPNEREEAEFLVAEIERVLGGTSFGSIDAGRADGNREGQLAFHDIAVLFRTSAQADGIERALERAGIPYQRGGEESLCLRPHVAPLLQRLRSLLEPAAVPADLELAEEVGRLEVAALISRLVLSEPLAPRQREAAELLATLAVPYRRDLSAFLSQLPLWQAGDLELLPQRVALLTLHAAKGLEFPLVFIAGCEDGLLPLYLPGRGAGDGARVDLEEERRLLYVGMTRAKSRLVMTWAQQCTLFGSTQTRAPSPFLQGVPSPLLCSTAPATPRRRAQQLSLL